MADSLNLLKKLTLTRAWNLVKIFTGFYVSRLSRRAKVWGVPFSVTIEPTNLCNLKCPECPTGIGALTRPTGVMALSSFRRILDGLPREVFYAQLFFQGEPFLNKDLLEMVRYARARNMYVSISTNAHFLDVDTCRSLVASGLERLIISLDGMTGDSYSRYRVNGNLHKVLEGLALLDREKHAARSRNPRIILQYLVTKYNEHEIPELKRLAKKHGATAVLKTMQVSSLENATAFLPENPNYTRYERTNGTLRTRSTLHNYCGRLWDQCVITWDGRIVPCCFDKDAAYSPGSLEKDAFHDLWRSPGYQDFRNSVLKNRKKIPMCQNCTEGLKVYR